MQAIRLFFVFIVFASLLCKNNEDLASLYIAVRNHNIEKVKELAVKVNVNQVLDTTNLKTENIRLYENRNPVLIEAVILNQLDIIKALVERGANVNASNKSGSTALMLAAQNDYTEILNYLLKSGADVSQKDNEGFTAFMYAGFQGHINSINTLLNAGSNINEKDNLGNTVLMWSVRYGNTETVKLLLAKNADDKIKNNDSLTALDHARKMKQNRLIELLSKLP